VDWCQRFPDELGKAHTPAYNSKRTSVMRMAEWLEDEQIRGTLLLLGVVGLVVF
jgi:hypothetical protein